MQTSRRYTSSYDAPNSHSDRCPSSADISDNWDKIQINPPSKSRYLKPTPTQSKSSNNTSQVSVSLLPEKFRSIFTFTHFNRMQSKSFDKVYQTNDNCVISSPTGSGKTALFELAIIKLLNLKLNSTDDSLLNAKILYMAPTKALCKERYDDWCTKFQPLNCNVGLLTGDTSFVELDSIKKSDLIVCTPEKWDALTRKWSDYSKLLDLVKLLLVDEIHFLREKRGTSLEVVITRMMTLSLNLRIIALSATVPNIQDVSNWLSKSAETNNTGIKTHTLVYDDKYRAVSLEKTVYGYKTAGTTNPFKFEIYLNGKLPDVIKTHSKDKPVLIFCSTRNSTIATAKFLSQEYLNRASTILNVPHGVNKELVELVQKGVAYHHAGLSLVERKFVEYNFINGNVRILCSTSTLAVGVNLPAYLVIIKGTKVWNNNAMEEYNELDLMQLMGRAGRPQFETKGACVIMTDDTKKDRYLRLVKGTEKLESSLHLNMYENITAEITLKTIRSSETAFNWLQCTFFYQRYKQNPTAYPTIFSSANVHHSLDIQLKIFLGNILDELEREEMIVKVGNEYESTVYGAAMSKSYVLFETIKVFTKSKEKLTLEESLALISKSLEFKELRVKMVDKKLLKDINKNPLMFSPVSSVVIEKYYEKVSILLQFELGGIEFPSYQGSMKLHHEFNSEKIMIFKNLPRIMKVATEIYSYKKDAISLNSFLKLNRCISGKTWENSALVLKQFEGIGLAYAKKLNTRGVTTIEKIKELPRDKLEYYLGMKPGAGQKIARSIANMPQLSLKIEDLKCETNGNVQFTISVDLLNEDNKVTYVWNGQFAHINVLTDVSGKVLDFRRLPLKKLIGGKSFHLKAQLTLKSDYIKVYFNSDEIAGIGKSETLDVKQATHCLKEDDSQRTIEHSNPFEFSDDDEVIGTVFGDKVTEPVAKPIPKEIKKTKETPKVITKIIPVEFSKLSTDPVTSLPDTSTNTEPSFIECHHKCADKTTCRHICCKEGIPTKKIKQCKHACKDKSQCRHMCCKEQYEYEQKQKVKNAKKLRQKTLDLSLYMSDLSNEQTDIFEDIDDDSSDLGIISTKRIDSKPAAKSVSKIPVFLRRVDGRPKQKIQIDSLEKDTENQGMSKYFTPSKEKKKSLLDTSSPYENYDDTFDSALDKAIKKQKRFIPSDENEEPLSKRHQKDGYIITQRPAKMNVELPKLAKPLNESNKKSMSSVEDIVIFNQTMPKVSALRRVVAKERIVEPEIIEPIVIEDIAEDKENDESNEGYSFEYITMTSVADDAVNKDVFGFLDSDIEFD